ncbi:unnamed protein product [Timema podura]|uniref:Uncharacterized protein n=1 Tax=Timema podura TaxID=61482 RepID=A0ABN7P4P3_TIMPD|nr:unnamed protein product [Timema podura]
MMEEEETAHVETYWCDQLSTQLCRLCANSDYCMLPIFEGDGVEQEIEMKIHKYLPIERAKPTKVIELGGVDFKEAKSVKYLGSVIEAKGSNRERFSTEHDKYEFRARIRPRQQVSLFLPSIYTGDRYSFI